MKKINIPLPEELHRNLKRAAVLEKKTLKQFVIDALEEETR